MDTGAISFIPYIINGGVALVVMFLMIMKFLVPGWTYTEQQEEIKELKRALIAERERSDTAAAATASIRDVLLSLRGRAYEEEVERRASVVEEEKARTIPPRRGSSGGTD